MTRRSYYWQAGGERRGGGWKGIRELRAPFHDRAPFFQAPLIFRLNYLRCYGIISDRPLCRLPLWTLSIHQISKYTRWNIYVSIYRSGRIPGTRHAFEFLTLRGLWREWRSVLRNSELESNNNRFYYLFYLFFFFFLFFFLLKFRWRLLTNGFLNVYLFDIDMYIYILIFVRDLWTVKIKINTKVGVQKFRSRLVYSVIRNNWGFG